jgi:hypothetical protein
LANKAAVDELWHCTLSILPHISEEAVDNFLSEENIVNETTIRGYKFTIFALRINKIIKTLTPKFIHAFS